MKNFKAYLYHIRIPILTFITPLLIIMTTLFIFKIRADLILYMLCFSMFIGGVYLWIGWSHFKQVLSQEERIAQLEETNQEYKDQLHNIRVETENYFLTWLHQMKTPISAAQLLLRDMQGESTAQLRLLLTDIDKYTGMALSYIKLMNPGTDLEFTRVSLDQIIQPILKKYRYQFIYHQISLDYIPIQEVITTDAHWTSIMVEQMLSNALKYTPHGGSIRIYFDSHCQELAIQDTGIGIQSSDIHKIFDKGYVGFNGRLHEKASGLGLYLVKLIGHRLSQPVRVESHLHQGSTFYIQCQLTKV